MKPTKEPTVTGTMKVYTCILNGTVDGKPVTVTGLGDTREAAINDAISEGINVAHQNMTVKDMKVQLMEVTYKVPVTTALSLEDCNITDWRTVKEEP